MVNGSDLSKCMLTVALPLHQCHNEHKVCYNKSSLLGEIFFHSVTGLSRIVELIENAQNTLEVAVPLAESWRVFFWGFMCTFQGTNLSLLKVAGKMMFFFHRWDMLVPKEYMPVVFFGCVSANLFLGNYVIIWPPACDVETDSNKVITARFDIIKESRSLATLKWNHDFHISLKQILKQERLEFTPANK